MDLLFGIETSQKAKTPQQIEGRQTKRTISNQQILSHVKVTNISCSSCII